MHSRITSSRSRRISPGSLTTLMISSSSQSTSTMTGIAKRTQRRAWPSARGIQRRCRPRCTRRQSRQGRMRCVHEGGSPAVHVNGEARIKHPVPQTAPRWDCPFRDHSASSANLIRRELAAVCCRTSRWARTLYALSLRVDGHQDLPSDGHEAGAMAIAENDRSRWSSRREICPDRRFRAYDSRAVRVGSFTHIFQIRAPRGVRRRGGSAGNAALVDGRGHTGLMTGNPLRAWAPRHQRAWQDRQGWQARRVQLAAAAAQAGTGRGRRGGRAVTSGWAGWCGGMLRPLGSRAPVSSNATTPLQSRLHPCSG
jgi:hypothetical protein